MLNALKNAGIEAIEIAPDEIIGKTARGEDFYIHRAYGALGVKYVLKITDVYFGARCTKESIIKTILSRQKPRRKRTIRVTANFKDGDVVMMSFKNFKGAIKIVDLLKQSADTCTVNMKEIITNV